MYNVGIYTITKKKWNCFWNNIKNEYIKIEDGCEMENGYYKIGYSVIIIIVNWKCIYSLFFQFYK